MHLYDCKNCLLVFAAEFSTGHSVTCTICGAKNEVEFDEGYDPEDGEEYPTSVTVALIVEE